MKGLNTDPEDKKHKMNNKYSLLVTIGLFLCIILICILSNLALLIFNILAVK